MIFSLPLTGKLNTHRLRRMCKWSRYRLPRSG